MIKDVEITKNYYKSGEVAKMLGVSTRTIQNYCMNGQLTEVFVNSRRLIPKESVIVFLKEKGIYLETEERKDVIYARVSTHKQKIRGDLDRQISVISQFAVTQNPKNMEIISDIGSG